MRPLYKSERTRSTRCLCIMEMDARISSSPSRPFFTNAESWINCDVDAPSDRGGDTVSPGPEAVSACPRLITASAPRDVPICGGSISTRLANGARVWAIVEPLGRPGPSSGPSRIQSSAPCDLERRCFGALAIFSRLTNSTHVWAIFCLGWPQARLERLMVYY